MLHSSRSAAATARRLISNPPKLTPARYFQSGAKTRVRTPAPSVIYAANATASVRSGGPERAGSHRQTAKPIPKRARAIDQPRVLPTIAAPRPSAVARARLIPHSRLSASLGRAIPTQQAKCHIFGRCGNVGNQRLPGIQLRLSAVGPAALTLNRRPGWQPPPSHGRGDSGPDAHRRHFTPTGPAGVLGAEAASGVEHIGGAKADGPQGHPRAGRFVIGRCGIRASAGQATCACP
jgi:hypothetical protein